MVGKIKIQKIFRYSFFLILLASLCGSLFAQKDTLVNNFEISDELSDKQIYDKAQALMDFGDSLFLNTNEEVLSIKYFERALGLFQTLNDSERIDYANYSLGVTYNYIEKYKTSIDYLKKALSSKDAHRIMSSSYYLSDSYYFDGKIDSTIYFLEKAYILSIDLNELNWIDVIISDFVSIYTYDIVDLEKAIFYLKESTDIFAGTEPYIAASNFHVIGSLYYDQNKYFEAIKSYEKSKKVWVSYIPSYKDSIEYLDLLDMLSTNYNSVGNYDSLEAIQAAIIDIGKTNNLNTMDERRRLDMMFNFHNSVGRDPEVFYDQYLELRKKIWKKIKSPKYNLSDMDSARLYQELAFTFKFNSDNKDTSVSYWEKSLEYFESIDTTNLSTKSLVYDSNFTIDDLLYEIMNSRIPLSQYILEMGNIEYSNNLLEKNINLYNQVSGNDDYEDFLKSIYISSIGHLGTNSIEIKDYDKAIEYFELTSSFNKDNNGRDMFWLASIYYYKKNYKKSVEYFTKELKINKKRKLIEELMLSYYNIGESYFMDEQIEKSVAYLDSSINILDKITNSLAADNKINLLNKHMNAIQLQSYNYFITGEDLKLIELIEKYRSLILKEKLAIENIDSNYDIELLQSLLNEEECIFLFLNVDMSELYSMMENPDIIHPILIYIDRNKIISEKINIPEKSITETRLDRILEFEIKYLLNNSILQRSNIADIHQKKFYTYFLDPIQHLLKNKKKINILLDGSLNLLPLELLIDPNGNYLINSFDINYLSSLQLFINKRLKVKSDFNTPSILAIGSPKMPETTKSINNYINEENVRSSIMSKINVNKSIAEELSFMGYADWEELPGALDEISNISKQFNNIKALTGSNATELSVKILNDLNDYDIIHFATHSMIIKDIPEASSIILAPSDKSGDDGYLNIKEISKLNIESSFINLSSCESGVGEILSGQGVNNFIQAFEYAGAESVLVSLWPIDDKSTSLFMTSFYNKINSGNIYDHALSEVKREFISGEYGEEYKKPYYWAPFVYYGK